MKNTIYVSPSSKTAIAMLNNLGDLYIKSYVINKAEDIISIKTQKLIPLFISFLKEGSIFLKILEIKLNIL